MRIDAAGAGAIKPPSAILPPIHKGQGRLVDPKASTVTDDAIKGKYALNLLNHPSVEIDRRTGDIDMHGMGLPASPEPAKSSSEEPGGKKF